MGQDSLMIHKYQRLSSRMWGRRLLDDSRSLSATAVGSSTRKSSGVWGSQIQSSSPPDLDSSLMCNYCGDWSLNPRIPAPTTRHQQSKKGPPLSREERRSKLKNLFFSTHSRHCVGPLGLINDKRKGRTSRRFIALTFSECDSRARESQFDW